MGTFQHSYEHTSHHLLNTLIHPTINTPPPLLFADPPYICHISRESTSIHSSSSIHPFMHSAITPPSLNRRHTLPLRLVRLARKRLMELSSTKMHRHLLYPQSDDSLSIVNPSINTHAQAHNPPFRGISGKAEHRCKRVLVIGSIMGE